jgi:hypothetical protein
MAAVLLCLTSLVLGCGGEPEINVEGVERVALYSIDFLEHLPGEEPEGRETFHGYHVLGRVEFKDAGRIEELLGAFNEGVARGGAPVDCFWPRHALRVEDREGETSDYVICFECFQFIVYRAGTSATRTIARSPSKAFDSFLREAGVTLAPSLPG